MGHALFKNHGGNDPGLTFHNGAGFIQQHGVGAAHLLDKRAALNQHALLDRRVDGRGESRGRGQLDAAGIIDDQHLQRLLRVSGYQPYGQAQQKIQRNQIVGEPVRIALNGGLFQLTGLHHVHNAGNNGLVAHFARLHMNVAALDHSAGKNLVAFPLFHRHKLAGNRALIHYRRAVHHLAVYGDFFAGMHGYHIACADLVHGAVFQLAVRHYLPGFALIGGQHFLDGGAGAFNGVGGHQLRQVGQRQNHQRRMAREEVRDGAYKTSTVPMRRLISAPVTPGRSVSTSWI